MWTLLSIAAANTLDFVRFDLVGTDDGVSLEYVLAADDWVVIQSQRNEGASTAVTVTLQADDYTYSAVVPLNASSRTLSVSIRPWPTGTQGAISVREGNFERVAVGDEAGVELLLAVQGGVDGARPSNAPLSSDPIERNPRPPKPVTSLPPPDPPLQPAATEPAATEPTATEPAPEPAPPPAAAVPADTANQTAVINSCKGSFRDLEDQGLCMAAMVGRVQALQEINACSALARPRHQRSCIETTSSRVDPFVEAIEACTTALGSSGDALSCVLAAGRHQGDPTDDIRSCTSHISDPGDAVGCIKRTARMTSPSEPLLRACHIGFPEDALACMSRAARSPYDRTDLVNACTTSFQREQRTRCLSILAPAPGADAAGVVKACVRLFDTKELELECLERARSQPSGERVAHCGTLDRRSAILDCIGR